MRYALKRSGGEVVAYSTTPIVADEDADVFRSGRTVWADPRPSDGGVVETGPDVPAVVTMRQARRALHAAGLLTSVETAIDALEEPLKTAARIDWDHSQEVQRTATFVSVLAPALNLSEAQLDALFIAASAIPA